MALPDIVEVLG